MSGRSLEGHAPARLPEAPPVGPASQPSPAEPALTRLAPVLGFLSVHLALLSLPAVGVDARSLALCATLYGVRMFGITCGYHRYFSHRAFRTSRAMQFVFGFAGASTGQKGPLWWAGVHRQHHRASDKPGDPHSPRDSFFHAYLGWLVHAKNTRTNVEDVPDLLRYPELRWLDRYHMIAPVSVALGCHLLFGLRGLVVGFCGSSVLIFHGTFAIGSISHVPGFGKQRYDTGDNSRNHWLLGIVTMGEGWHNNHHRFMRSARLGLFWWEADLGYYALRALAALGIVWDVRWPSKQRMTNALPPVRKMARQMLGKDGRVPGTRQRSL